MILAAGLGTRLKPWTDHHPKALAVVNGKSLLERNVTYLQKFGIYEVVVNVHHFADQIIEAIEKNKGWGSQISISDETNEVLETGGGLIKAQNLLADATDVLLINCDILTDLNLDDFMAQHQNNQALATLAVANRPSSRNLIFDAHERLVGWRNSTTGDEKMPGVNEQTPYPLSAKAFSGIHLLSNQIFEINNFIGKFSIIDLYLEACATYKIMGYDHSQNTVLDVGKPEAILAAEKLFQ